MFSNSYNHFDSYNLRQRLHKSWGVGRGRGAMQWNAALELLTLDRPPPQTSPLPPPPPPHNSSLPGRMAQDDTLSGSDLLPLSNLAHIVILCGVIMCNFSKNHK